MLNIKLRMLRSVVCWDGEPNVEMIPQMTTADDPMNRNAWHRVKTLPGETLEALAVRLRAEHPTVIGTVEILPTVTVRRHEHIGEYGSPRKFGCRALEGY